MAETVTITPSSPVATKDAARIDLSEFDSNRTDHSEFRYVLSFRDSGDAEYGRSYVFNVSADGDHQFFTYVFPTSAITKVDVLDAADDSLVKSQAVTVQAP